MNTNTESTRWYYSHDGQAVGPLPFSSIKALAKAGQLTPQSLVVREGLEDWQALSAVLSQASSLASLQSQAGATAPYPLPDPIPQPPKKPRLWPAIAALLFLYFLYPLGLVLLWRSKGFSRNGKIVASGLFGFLFLLKLADSQKTQMIGSRQTEVSPQSSNAKSQLPEKIVPSESASEHSPPTSIPFKILERDLYYRALHGPWKVEVGLVDGQLPHADELNEVVHVLVDKAGGPKDDEQYYVEFYLPGMAGKSGGGSMAFAVGGLDSKDGKQVLIQYHPDNQDQWPEEYRAMPVPMGNWELPVGTHTKGPLKVAMTVSVKKTGSAGTIAGTANLPDGMTIHVVLKGGKEYFGGGDYVVGGGSFGGPWPLLPSGRYTISVWVRPAIKQPLSVQAVIGIWGANLAGPLVNDGPHGRDVKAELTQEVSVASDDTEKGLDLVASYQRDCSKLYGELMSSKGASDFGRTEAESRWRERLQKLRESGEIPTLAAFDTVSALKTLFYEYDKSRGIETDTSRSERRIIDSFLGEDSFLYFK